MRWVKRGTAVMALSALLLSTLRPGGASADELLVMPFACSMIGGQPMLTPSQEQGHRIFGQRDQRRFKACSPVNPDMCRQWTVHRFDLDCDGARVSWVSVVAATNEGSRRAWLLDGRLLLRMGAKWSLAPDDPCAQESGQDNRPIYGGRLRRQCAERLATAPPPVVEMPFGYAPMLGIDGIFVTAKTSAPPDVPKSPAPDVSRVPSTLPPIIAGEPLSKPPVADEKPPKSASAEAKPVLPPPPPSWLDPRDPKAGEPKLNESKSKEAVQLPPPPPPPVLVTPPAPQPVPKVASTPPPTAPPAEEPVRKAEPEAEPKPPAPKVAVATPPAAAKEAPGSQGPRLVTLPAPPPPVPDVEKKADTKPVADASTAPKVTPAKEANGPVPVGQPEASPEGASSSGLLSLFRTTTTGAIVAFAGLALGLLTAFALARRREHAQDVGRRRRDISALSLDGKRPKASAHKASARGGAGSRHKPGAPASVQAAAQVSAQPGAQPRRDSKPPVQSADLMARLSVAEVGDWSDRMPTTREEALEVLGIGIAPSANATAIKKIVDGLRMSWHPDHATDETDRALREHRSKQINAAWEILQGQRAEV
jgi:hypothetical protein